MRRERGKKEEAAHWLSYDEITKIDVQPWENSGKNKHDNSYLLLLLLKKSFILQSKIWILLKCEKLKKWNPNSDPQSKIRFF